MAHQRTGLVPTSARSHKFDCGGGYFLGVTEMSRSGYSDDCEHGDLYRANVDRAINGKRGQAFLVEMADAMDAMTIKRLIQGELITSNRECCAIGSVCMSRGIDTSEISIDDTELIANTVGISRAMVSEIECVNDDDFDFYSDDQETPEKRWIRIREWVNQKIKGSN